MLNDETAIITYAILQVAWCQVYIIHYDGVIMGAIASQITSLTIAYSTVYSAQIKVNIKAPRHWPLWGEFTGTGEFPAQRASYAENVSIWWRHHVEHNNKMICQNHFVSSKLFCHFISIVLLALPKYKTVYINIWVMCVYAKTDLKI